MIICYNVKIKLSTNQTKKYNYDTRNIADPSGSNRISGF